MLLQYFFADENISDEVVEWLEQNGCEISSIKKEKLFGIADVEIIEKAFTEKRIILTHDSDFGKIIYTRNIEFLSIIYLRPGHFNGSYHIATLETILANWDKITEGSIVVGYRKNNNIKIRIKYFPYDNKSSLNTEHYDNT